MGLLGCSRNTAVVGKNRLVWFPPFMDIGNIAFAEEHVSSTWMPTRTGHGLVYVYVPPGSYQVPTYHCLGLGSRIPWRPDIRAPFPGRLHFTLLGPVAFSSALGRGVYQGFLREAGLRRAALQ